MLSQLKRIVSDPKICHGRACVKGTRVMVWQIVQCLAHGNTVEEILDAYPRLTRDDVNACILYAAELTRDRVLPIEVGP